MWQHSRQFFAYQFEFCNLETLSFPSNQHKNIWNNWNNWNCFEYPEMCKIMWKVAKMSRYCRYCKKGENVRRVEFDTCNERRRKKTKLSPWGYKYSLNIRRAKWMEEIHFGFGTAENIKLKYFIRLKQQYNKKIIFFDVPRKNALVYVL